MIVHSMEQGSPEWLQARCGLATGSRATAVLDVTKNGAEGSKRRTYRLELVAERISGLPTPDGYVTAEMMRGRDMERAALDAYEAQFGVCVQRVGFITHDTLPLGTSPDALVGEDGAAEVKCPKTSTHLASWDEGGTIPEDYLPQLQHTLLVTGRAWIDWISFDDRVPADLQLLVIRLTREDACLPEYKAVLDQFMGEVDATVARVRAAAARTEAA